MSDKQTFMHFPCDFPLKIIGNNSECYLTDIETIIRKHFPNDDDVNLRHTFSENNRYLSITATIRVYDQPTLDSLYQALTTHPDTKMVL